MLLLQLILFLDLLLKVKKNVTSAKKRFIATENFLLEKLSMIGPAIKFKNTEIKLVIASIEPTYRVLLVFSIK